MRTLLITTLAAAGLLSLAACGQEPTPNGASDQVGTTTVDTSRKTGEPPEPPVSRTEGSVAVPAGVTQVPADQVDASAVPEYYNHRGQVWVFDDGYSLQAFAMANSGCGRVEAEIVDQSATGVRIKMGPRPRPKDDSGDEPVCTEALTPKPVTVALDAPLGDRKIFLEG